MKGSVLIIEDNPSVNQMLSEAISRQGYQVLSAYEGHTGLSLLQNHPISIVILDLMLPDMGGDKILSEIRSGFSTPVLIISAKDTDVDIAIHLGLGADDYLSKPFSMVELIARIKALLRRVVANEIKKPITQIGSLKLNIKNFEAIRSGETHMLTLKEAKILELLISNANTTFTKKEIYEAIWKEDYYQDDNVINVHIRRIREKIEEDPSSPQIIQTVWGVGYRFINPVIHPGN